MHSRPLSLLIVVLLMGAVALLVSALQSARGQGLGAGQLVMMVGCAALAGIGGFKVGRMMASGQLSFGARLCRSCNAKRTTRAAFCESCHRRD